jgi:hypothetical protein
MSYRKILSAGAPSNDALQLGADGEAVYLPAESLAAAGSDQAGAGAISDAVCNVTAADGTKGVVLPAAKAGRVFYVYNSVATNGLKIYPAGTETINGGSGGAAVTIEGKTLAVFVCPADGNWGATYTANT